MQDKLLEIKNKALQEIAATKEPRNLELVKIRYLGRQDGQLTKILRSLASLSLEEKKKYGTLANQIKNEISAGLAQKERELKGALREEFFDVTLPGKEPAKGHLHPVTQVRIELEEVFKTMGFEVHEGDELVTDYYNFESLNFPKDHPARDTQDTFFVKSEIRNSKLEYLMRTHTSTMQVKIMEKRQPPLRVIVPGRCFRNEATDASHEHTFYQMEGFVVDKNISIANLIYTQKALLSAIFKRDVKVRLRPGFFPFVEPGFELDCSCTICGGRGSVATDQGAIDGLQKATQDPRSPQFFARGEAEGRKGDRGCSVCKQTGWVELIPCGMIHPKVFEFAGYPKGKYTGFAFGLGLTRLAMMKYSIDDIRLFMSGDLRFLRQF